MVRKIFKITAESNPKSSKSFQISPSTQSSKDEPVLYPTENKKTKMNKKSSINILDIEPGILEDIVKRAFNVKYELRDWDDITLLHFEGLALNPKAIDILTENKELIYWVYLSKNPKVIKLLEERIIEEAKMDPYELDSYNKISWGFYLVILNLI